MLEIILAGGWLMAPILLCSTLAVAIIIERFWTLRKSKVTPQDLGATVEDWAARHELDSRHLGQLRAESPLGRIYASALVNRKRSRDVIKEAVEDTGRHVVHDLERFLNTLGTIAGISPLLGLLGTVIGMILTFQAITLFGTGDPKTMAGGISQALVTTVLGLVVAIPTTLLHAIVNSRARSVIHVLEEQSAGIIADHAEKAGRPLG